MDLKQIASLEFNDALRHYLAHRGIVDSAREVTSVEISRSAPTRDSEAEVSPDLLWYRGADDRLRSVVIPGPDEFSFDLLQALILTDLDREAPAP